MNNQKLQFLLKDAILKGQLSEVEHLFAAGADPNFLSNHGDTPLEHAVRTDSIPIMELLCAAGADVNIKGTSSKTPLFLAAALNRVDAGRWLLRHGADESASSVHGVTSLDFALWEGHVEFAAMLLDERPQLRGQLLEVAASKTIGRMDIDVAKWLLEQGVSPEMKTVSGTPWIVLAQKVSTKTCAPLTRMLLEAGSNINSQDVEGNTPLHVAALKGDVGDFLTLLRAGADPDMINQLEGSTRKFVRDSGAPELQSAFESWEASRAAHDILQNSCDSLSVRPLTFSRNP